MPIVGLFLGAAVIPPVITIGGIFGNAGRTFIYREKINWQVIRWELPGAIVGGCLGAFALTRLRLEWLSVLVAIFLIISAVSFLLNKEVKTFEVPGWYFLPAGFIYAFLSGLLGSMGPALAPFYLNYGLQKEELLATQALNRVVVHVIKVIVYAIFGALSEESITYGILIGIAAFPGNWLGHQVLERISASVFRNLVITFIMVSGIFMLWEQRQLFTFLGA
jgi:uncharacterized membrane protein YfcA